jgi:hypothetical protein
MSAMEERVARAIAVSLEVPSDSWRDHVDEARAAIAAMREPTADMLRAGRYNLGHDEEGRPISLEDGEVDEIWQTMIDEALK